MVSIIETPQSDWESVQRLLSRFLYAAIVLAIAFAASLLAGRMTSKLVQRTCSFQYGEHQ
jgi:hypothetical protein